ncbi:MAG: hypothetical protein AABY27_03840, partial [Pseudomonadota bacterium]
VDPDIDNIAAIKAYEKTGFKRIKASTDTHEILMLKETLMTVIIYLIGRSGTGKYTIAKELAQSGYKIIDNQLINNPIFSILDLDNGAPVPKEAWEAIGKIRNIVFDFMSNETQHNYILTNELFDDDIGDHQCYAQVEEIAIKRGSIFVPIKLQISEAENIKRITNQARALRYKSLSIDERDRDRKLIQISHPNLLEIEVSDLTPSAVAKIILAFISEKL